MQFDEKWAFVGKKQKHCDPRDPADTNKGTTGITSPSIPPIASS